MNNLNMLNRNYKLLNKTLSNYKSEDRDTALKLYGSAIKQVPDHYNSKKLEPTTIAGAARNLIHAIKTNDPVLLKIEPKEYMDILHKNRKDGNWTFFDYDNFMPEDSSPEVVKNVLTAYKDGISNEIDKVRNEPEFGD